MSADDLDEYQFQLDQVQLKLSGDPANEELKKLEQDIKELIELTQQHTAATQKPKKPSAQKIHTPQAPAVETSSVKLSDFAVGQDVMARWEDGQFHRATIQTIGGADQFFSVVFRGYKDTTLIKPEDIMMLNNKKRGKGVFENIRTKRKESDVKTNSPSPIKKKASKVEENKSAWLNFAKSKGKKASSAMSKESIFKTPDNPQSKVGVIGSGRGMTASQSRGKHIYAESEEQNNDD